MRKYSVNLTEDAENDIAELMAFYEELVDAESAVKFLDEAMETVANLENFGLGGLSSNRLRKC